MRRGDGLGTRCIGLCEIVVAASGSLARSESRASAFRGGDLPGTARAAMARPRLSSPAAKRGIPRGARKPGLAILRVASVPPGCRPPAAPGGRSPVKAANGAAEPQARSPR
jgi:hypothetical protein